MLQLVWGKWQLRGKKKNTQGERIADSLFLGDNNRSRLLETGKSLQLSRFSLNAK